MAFSNKIFFLCIILLILSISSISKSADLIGKECGNTFTNNDILQGNINSTILDLVTKTSANGFANSTYGSSNDSSNVVYGIAECRGDIIGPACSACITDAAQYIQTACPNATESRIWYQQCFLRYSTSNFIGQPDTSYVGVWYSGYNVSDPHAFKQTMKELLATLWAAASNGENRKLGWGEIENRNYLRNNETIIIYGMAQCTWDLQESACFDCLNVVFNILKSRCGEQRGCYAITKSCAMRYEIRPFLFLNDPANLAVTTSNITFSKI